ncbi:MAG: SpoIVB peptidase S55 domain-containing protein, partial [Terriglobia bacterium]
MRSICAVAWTRDGFQVSVYRHRGMTGTAEVLCLTGLWFVPRLRADFSELFLVRFHSLYSLFFALSLVLAPLSLQAQSNVQFFPLSGVRPGLKGVGRTIFEGDKIQEFQVELIGVLKNVLAPKHDAVLARLYGPGIDATGVVAGMSGSPVYIDGKLLGAVAIAFPFAKAPYTLITPIEEMLRVVPQTSAESASYGDFNLPWHDAAAPSPLGPVDRWIPDEQFGPALWASTLSRW